MRKLITILTAMLLFIGVMTGCSNNEPVNSTPSLNQQEPNSPTDAPTNPDDNNTEPTTPAYPTAEELKVLYDYSCIVYDLEYTKYSLFNDGNNGSYAFINDLYFQLTDIDFTVIDRWARTEFATAEYLRRYDYFVPWDEMNWNYTEVLAQFTKVEDVMLRTELVQTDIFGTSTVLIKDSFAYDANGYMISAELDDKSEYNRYLVSAVNIDPLGLLSYNYASYVIDENGNIEKTIWDAKEYHYDTNGIAGDLFVVIPVYDETGNKVQDDFITKYGDVYKCVFYYYDGDNRLTDIGISGNPYSSSFAYTYDEKGRVIKEVESYWFHGTNWDGSSYSELKQTYTLEYSYDEKGVLSTATYTYNEYSANEEVIDNKTIVCQYTFVCDEQGRIVTQVINDHTVYNVIYGDYYHYASVE